MTRRRIHAVVHGVVQGVGYRMFARRSALSLGVGGWVRNRSDGAVELEAEADAEILERFLGVLGEGPMASRVDRVESNELASPAGETEFEIRF